MRGIAVKSKLSRLFDGREPGGLDAPLNHPPLPVDQFQFDKPCQVSDMVHIFRRTFVNADLIFPRSAEVKFPTTAISAIEAVSVIGASVVGFRRASAALRRRRWRDGRVRPDMLGNEVGMGA